MAQEKASHTVERDASPHTARARLGRAGGRKRGLLTPFVVTFSAFLLFLLEPMAGKLALPRFGGAPSVWIACLAFFQLSLLLGYVYVHTITRRASAWAIHIHSALLVASLSVLPILAGPTSRPDVQHHPVRSLLGMLGTAVGLPFVMLASTSLLIQVRAASHVEDSRAASRLFALSNIGSLLALVMYPLVVEPRLPMAHQRTLWSWLYGGFVGFALVTLARYRNDGPPTLVRIHDRHSNAALRNHFLWFLLSAVPSALLLAVTQFILRDVAAVPLLWILPLALYLLSLALSFGWDRWFVRPLWYPLFLLCVRAMMAPSSQGYLFHNYRALLFIYAIGLFVCCCLCHAELAALKPEPSGLPSFYLLVAAGGAGGSLLVAALAPVTLATDEHDIQLILASAVLLMMIVGWQRLRSSPSWHRAAIASVVLPFVAVFVVPFAWTARVSDGALVFRTRTFFGSLRVSDRASPGSGALARELLNGNINHGRQFVAEDKRDTPLTYYTRDSGIGTALQELGRYGPLRVGVIGLGVGTLAAYGRAGDVYRFYELDPAVVAIATKHFWFLSRCAAAWTLVRRRCKDLTRIRALAGVRRPGRGRIHE